MWIKTFLFAILTVLVFYALLFAFGWLDVGEQTNLQILRNIFAGQYLFFTVPVFILSFIVYSGHKDDGKNLVLRMLLVLIISIAAYMAVTSYLLTRLNG
jgi:hypothetical protein